MWLGVLFFEKAFHLIQLIVAAAYGSVIWQHLCVCCIGLCKISRTWINWANHTKQHNLVWLIRSSFWVQLPLHLCSSFDLSTSLSSSPILFSHFKIPTPESNSHFSFPQSLFIFISSLSKTNFRIPNLNYAYLFSTSHHLRFSSFKMKFKALNSKARTSLLNLCSNLRS